MSKSDLKRIEGLGNLDFIYLQLFFPQNHLVYLANIIHKCQSINYTQQWYSQQKMASKIKLLSLHQLAIFMSLQEQIDIKNQIDQLEKKITLLKKTKLQKQKSNRDKVNKINSQIQQLRCIKEIRKQQNKSQTYTSQQLPFVSNNPFHILGQAFAQGNFNYAIIERNINKNFEIAPSNQQQLNKVVKVQPQKEQQDILQYIEQSKIKIPLKPGIGIKDQNNLKFDQGQAQDKKKKVFSSFFLQVQQQVQQSNFKKSEIIPDRNNSLSESKKIVKLTQSFYRSQNKQMKMANSRMISESNEVQKSQLIQSKAARHQKMKKSISEIGDIKLKNKPTSRPVSGVKNNGQKNQAKRKAINIYNVGEQVFEIKVGGLKVQKIKPTQAFRTKVQKYNKIKY